MEAKLQKWGNSLGLRIPSTILKSLDLKVGDVININEEDNKIVIIKKEKSKYSLQDRIIRYKGENMSNDFKWDEPKGNEIW